MFAANNPQAPALGDFWTATPELSPSSGMLVARYINNTYVLIGLGGSGGNAKLHTASSLDSWTYQAGLRTAWGDATFAGDIVWTGSTYIVVGNNTAATSSDLITWTAQYGLNSAWTSTNLCRGAVWNGTYCIAVGNDANVAYSTDGVTWTSARANLSATSWGTEDVRAVVASVSSVVAIVGNSGKFAVSATNGTTWTYDSGLSATGFGTKDALCMIYDGTSFVVGGQDGAIAARNGSTGVWTYYSGLTSIFGTDDVFGLVYKDGFYYACGGSMKLAKSADLTNWIELPGLNALNIPIASTAISIADIDIGLLVAAYPDTYGAYSLR